MCYINEWHVKASEDNEFHSTSEIAVIIIKLSVDERYYP